MKTKKSIFHVHTVPFATRLKNRALDAILFTSFSLLFIVGLVYALNYPSTQPNGEISGGKFMTYFNNMYRTADNCTIGQAMVGFTSDGTKICRNAEPPHGSQLFTSNGTFIVPTGVTRATISMNGGGGGGGGGGNGSPATGPGGGGGGGGYLSATVSNLANGQAVSIMVGGSGRLGCGSVQYGQQEALPGGDSSFGGIVFARGGEKGNSRDNGGGGGAGGTATAVGNYPLSTATITVTNSMTGGAGGTNVVGGASPNGGAGGVVYAGSGNFPGGGGGGAQPIDYYCGGAGAAGSVLITW
ncbi:MAG: hypothetical protein PHH16_05055 [Candidatus Gracilibacteria bacterium]|nr:hypothetical protein [Candidatus Gracilibacteria bacterium]